MIDAPRRPVLRPVADGPALALGRTHEVAGSARRAFAAWMAGALTGPALWIVGPRPGAPERLDPEGLSAFLDPARLVVARCPGGVDALWAAEEALRSGAVPFVALEPSAPPALTPVRRLQLAAEAGAAAAPHPPICLILTPEGGTAAAVETRWRADPLPGWAGSAAPGGGPARWRFALLRDKAGQPAAWEAVARRRNGPAAPTLRRTAAA
jgi:protein ImuA